MRSRLIRLAFGGRGIAARCPRWLRVAPPLLAIAALGFGGCAQSPQQVAGPHSKEYFPSSVYGPASRRVVADGEPIPHGGGQYLVGKPYTVAGQTYYPSERKISQVGLASWYGDAFHGRLTANGEVYDKEGFTAAHPTMPLPSYARVTNLRNNYSMIVRVNDRGPYHANRVMDVSRRVAEALDFQRGGTGNVKVEYVGRASLAGSDNTKLFATLRNDGPARVQGVEQPTLLAERAIPARVASLSPYAPADRTPMLGETERAGMPAPHRPLRSSPEIARGDVTSSLPHVARLSPMPRHSHESKEAHESTEAHESREARAERGARHQAEPGRLSRTTAHEKTENVRVATREPMPAPRPGRATMPDMKSAAVKPSAHSAKSVTRDIVLPPARLVRAGAEKVAPSARHAKAGEKAGLRMSRSRDD